MESKKHLLTLFVMETNFPGIHTHKKHKGFFSLIELVVVLAILALLASLLSPSLQKTMNAARELTCKNNLKGQGIALSTVVEIGPPGRTSASYNGDNSSFTENMEGRFPYTRAAHIDGSYHHWFSVLGKEMGYFENSGRGGRKRLPEPMSVAKAQEFRCPSADEQINWNVGKFSYGYNGYLGRDGYKHTKPLNEAKLISDISMPHKLIAVADMDEFKPKSQPGVVYGGYFIWPGGRLRNGTPAKWHTNGQIGTRHNYGSNNLFVDGHVEYLPFEVINNNVPKYLTEDDISFRWY